MRGGCKTLVVPRLATKVRVARIGFRVIVPIRSTSVSFEVIAPVTVTVTVTREFFSKGEVSIFKKPRNLFVRLFIPR